MGRIFRKLSSALLLLLAGSSVHEDHPEPAGLVYEPEPVAGRARTSPRDTV